MRSLLPIVLHGILAACGGAPAQPRPAESRERQDPPCLPYVDQQVRARADGTAVAIELHTSSRSCRAVQPPTVTSLARIDAAAATAACPIGQVVLRMWDRGHGAEEKPFIATLGRAARAELRQYLMYFADSAEAYVIDCPAAGLADYLVVEVMPRDERPKLELFVGNKPAGRGPHRRVTFSPPQP